MTPRVLFVPLLLLAACGGGPTTPEAATYDITEGACGDVVFVAAVGADSASAIAAVEAQKIAMYGEGAVRIEPHALLVVDGGGESPADRFYALHVREVGSGILVHSVFEVITTGGDLFQLRWCPD